MEIRAPIICLVGHIDHGKSSILEKIKGISIVKAEAGGITQCIGSYNIPLDTIKKICGKLLENVKLTIPGLLVIDTPGHAAFNNLRKRGGNLADIAIVVIDINEGVMDQTKESIEILKSYKTPFVVALNKIDLIPGWKAYPEKFLAESISLQAESTQKIFYEKLYNVVGQLFDLGFEADLYSNIEDFTKKVAIIPCSAKTAEGLAELLMVVSGLAQRYLEESLRLHVSGPGKGTILEVKEEKGLGKTIDVILYDGKIKQSDQIIIGDFHKPIITKIRALLEPENNKFKRIKEITAAAGVKISAPNLENAIAGMPIKVVTNLDQDTKEIQKEVQEVLLQLDNEGILAKADSLGSLEALINLLREHRIKVKKADIGEISKKDIAEASAEEDPLNKVIVGFNVKLATDDTKDVHVILSNIIYTIIDDLKEWRAKQEELLKAKELENLPKLVKIKVLEHCVFRQSNPCIVGVEVLKGKLTLNTQLFKASTQKPISYVKSMQLEKENIQEAPAGKQVAIALPDITAGRQVKEGDILYSFLTEQEFRKYKELKKFLSNEETELLKEIASIMRKTNPLWGV